MAYDAEEKRDNDGRWTNGAVGVAAAAAGAIAGAVAAKPVARMAADRATVHFTRRQIESRADDLPPRANRVAREWLQAQRDRFEAARDWRKNGASSFTIGIRDQDARMAGRTPAFAAQVQKWQAKQAKIDARKPGPKKDLALKTHALEAPVPVTASTRWQSDIRTWKRRGYGILWMKPGADRDAALDQHLRTKPRPERLSGPAQRVRQITRQLGDIPGRLAAIEQRQRADDAAFDEGRAQLPGDDRRQLELERQVLVGRGGPLTDERAYLLDARPRQKIDRREHTVRRRATAPAHEVAAMRAELQGKLDDGEIDQTEFRDRVKGLPRAIKAPGTKPQVDQVGAATRSRFADAAEKLRARVANKHAQLQQQLDDGEIDHEQFDRSRRSLPTPPPVEEVSTESLSQFGRAADALDDALKARRIDPASHQLELEMLTTRVSKVAAMTDLINSMKAGRTGRGRRGAPAPAAAAPRQEKVAEEKRFRRSANRANAAHRDISAKGMQRISSRVREEADRIASRATARAESRTPLIAARLRNKMAARYARRSLGVFREQFEGYARHAPLAGAILGGLAAYGVSQLTSKSTGRAEKLAKAFDEAKHPRGRAGRFAQDGSSNRALASRRDELPAEGDPPRVTLLVGMPGSGKSTWRQHAMAQGITRPTTIISTDDQVGAIASQYGLTFSQAFKLLDGKQVERGHTVALRAALKAGNDVIVDKINASPKSRAKILRMVPSHYEKHAVVFHVPEDVLVRRRSMRPGKVIPHHALEEMRAAYQEPTKGEFDFVHQAGLRKAAIPSQEDTAKKADEIEKRIAQRLARMFGQWTDTVEGDMLQPTGATIPAQMAGDLDHALEPLGAAVKSGAAQPVPITDDSGKQIAVSLLGRPKEVGGFVDQYRQDRIAELVAEQKDVIKQQLLAAATSGASTETMARSIRNVVGLTASQAGHVNNYEQELRALDPNALNRVLRDRRYDGTIAKAIQSGVGLSDQQVQKYTDAYHRRYLAYRATTIARTEAVGAANNGQAAAVVTYLDAAPGYDVEKTWIARLDGKERHDHHDLHGKTVIGMETPFVADSGDQLRWPHDPRGAARQVINCRCTFATRMVPRSDSASDSAGADTQP